MRDEGKALLTVCFCRFHGGFMHHECAGCIKGNLSFVFIVRLSLPFGYRAPIPTTFWHVFDMHVVFCTLSQI